MDTRLIRRPVRGTRGIIDNPINSDEALQTASQDPEKEENEEGERGLASSIVYPTVLTPYDPSNWQRAWAGHGEVPKLSDTELVSWHEQSQGRRASART